MQPRFSARRGLDPQSAHVLRRFVVLLGFMVVWSFAARPQNPLHSLMLMTSAATAIDCLIAALRRERFNAAVLNYWDSACGFFTISSLVMGVT